MNARRSTLRSLASAAALAAALVLPSAARAQEDPNVQHGFRPEKVYAFGEVDQVNLFNGNLMLSIPLGGSYGVNGGLSYGLVLTYNAKVWDLYSRSDTVGTYTHAEPYRYSNAGLGWRLSLGELDNSGYIGPDGGKHELYSTPREGGTGTAGYRYTRDGSYLRLWEQSSTSWQVQFPDGTKHTFTRVNTSSPWRLTNILDPYSNYLAISYPTTHRWQLTDGHRTHTVDFATLSNGEKVVSQVDLAAFGGARAVYRFVHQVRSISEPCGDSDTDPLTPTTRSVALLTQVELPDLSTWRMDGADDYYTTCTDGVTTIEQLPGMLKRIGLPTLGKIEWAYQTYGFPVRQTGLPGTWIGGSQTPGVKTKRVLNASGLCESWDGVGCQWTYTPSNGFGSSRSTRVTYPTGDETMFWFNQDIFLSTSTWNGWQYGLPMHAATTDGAGHFLSQEIYDGTAAGGVKKRSVYLRYEHDKLPSVLTVVDPWYNSNRRVAAEKTVFHDDAGRYAQSTRSSFDGVGNYRQTTLSGTFGAGDARSSFTNANPARGTYVLDPATNSTAGSINFSQWPTGTNWVLGTQKDASTSEGGATAKVDFCFEGEGTALLRPFLLRKRTMAGAAPGTTDVITTFVRDGLGNVVEERTYGGDEQAVGTTADLCALVLPASDAYQVRHTYVAGSRATSQWFNSNGTAFGGFKSLDLTIDVASGLPSSRRDVSGVHSDLVFDAMGRLTWEKPTTGNGAWTQYGYTRATSASAMANVLVTQRPNGSTTAMLAQSRVYFDPFGRVWRDQKLGANNVWSTVDTVHNAMGWRRSVTERMTGSPSKLTIFKDFDPFGRPQTIQPPDGTAHNVTLAYLGTRQVSRTVKVKTGATETNATTTERYDRQGRLHQVVEPSGASGANTTTTYGYDVGGRLVSVSMPAQSRSFGYDNRGFLLWERHPEKGVSGNGYVRYTEYDALGNPGRKLDAVATTGATTGAAIDVRFTYDRAARLTRVDEASGGFRLLKAFTYATANSGANRRQGKLQIADRYNYVSIGATPYTVLMRETYNYSGLGGRVSNRDLQSSVNGTAGEAFTQGWVYNDLGDVTSLTYPRCTWATCNGGAVMSPTIGFTYTRGWLTAVPGYANSISYHANGMVNQVAHTNGVIWTQALDPNAMRRPASYATTGATTNWTSGAYAYDGAGNVTAIGSNGYLYDPVSRLTSATQWTGETPGGGSLATQTAAYDPYGNITSLSTNGAGPTLTTSTSTNRLSSATFDSAGSMTSWNLNTYVYEPLGMTSTITASGVTTYHIYTADDERAWTFQPGAPSRWTIRDLDGKVLRELSNNAGTWFVEKDYVYRDGSLLAAATAAEILHYHPDHLGSPRLITGAGGVKKSYHLYHPYGAEATAFNQDTERLKFTGHERDLGNLASAADDIDYMHARFYQPQVGRFLAFDPASVSVSRADPQTWNRYAYGIGNPLKFSDPSGQAVRLEVDSQAMTIRIEADIAIWGEAASAELAQQIEQAIEAEWTNKVYIDPKTKDAYKVIVDVEVRSAGKTRPRGAENAIEIMSSPTYRSRVNFTRNSGRWGAHEHRLVYAHEFGHLMGLPDDYRGDAAKPGHEGHMMAGGSKKWEVHEHEIADVVGRSVAKFKKTQRTSFKLP
jgi:RHS repeat-associated protein